MNGMRQTGVPRRVFFTCWLAYTLFWTPYIVREHFPALTLMERGTLDVSSYLGWSDDIFRGPRGGAYINNNPGASLAGAAPLVLLRPALLAVARWNRTLHPPDPAGDTELFRRAMREGRGYYFLLIALITVAAVMAPATAGAMAYLAARLIDAGVPARASAGVALLCGLGTPIFFRAGYLNHNLLVTDAGLFALLLLWDPADRELGNGRSAAAGALAGFAVLCDFSGLMVLAVAAVYVWLRAGPRKWTALAAYGAGAAPFGLGLLVYQAWAFGNFLWPSQQYMVPTAPTSHGYRGFDWPSPALLWANFFDPRFGLFAYCPLLLLAAAGPFVRRVRFRMPRRETGIVLLYSAIFVVFCAANRYSWLQPSTGFRYLAPIVPGLVLLAAQTLQALPHTIRGLLAAGSLVQSWAMAAVHDNDVRLVASHLWKNGFSPCWMVRVQEAGAPVTWVWTLILYLAAAVLIVLIWCPRVRSARRRAA